MSILHITTARRVRVIGFAAITIVAAVLQSVQAAESKDYAELLGAWRLTKVLDSSEISSISDKEAEELVGKTLVIERDQISLAGETCKAPEFERHYEDTARYLREEAHAASGRLGLPEVVMVVDLSCTEALLKSYDKIVIYWKGFFFDAVRQAHVSSGPALPINHSVTGFRRLFSR